ncbi:putative FRE ferric reductase-like transmembrane component [Teratosphaeria nubilosa]|uniref:Putative FRE ferric reductase-like transmembrane component n=1 Tax=Teratosphaeria nubilosa TaxID=161662 RepID=A0A6G1L966_9PEZI|nr:putative FRE ferric reductase-like transmembrane component [Teratosphaeria nubilosa]
MHDVFFSRDHALFNFTDAAEQYSYGLSGVVQKGNYLFINILLICFLALLIVTVIFCLVHSANAWLRKLFTMGRLEAHRYWMHNHSFWCPKLKKELLYAPLWKIRHNREIVLNRKHHIDMGCVPGRFHTILLVLYCASNVAYMLALSWGRANANSVAAELRGRSGSLAAFNLIPTVLFALRNNPLIPLLKVSYDTFNLLHRWCARVVIIEATIHTICWGANALTAGGLYQVRVQLQTSTSYTWGMVGTCAMAVIFIQAWSPVRHAFYEVFINGHRLLAGIAIAGVWMHLDYANLPQFPYLQLVVAFWAIEVGWRVLRILWHNYTWRKGITKVTIEALPAEACRVTFELSRPWKWQPGCHVHAYLPHFALWSSHPFSIAWAENSQRIPISPMSEVDTEKLAAHVPSIADSSRDSMPPSFRVGDRQPSVTQRYSMTSRKKSAPIAPFITTVTEKTHQSSLRNIALPRDSTVTSVSLIMRARDGLTRKLYEKASNTRTGTLTTWGAIEGPYGGHDDMTSYGTVILFAGGVGITHCIGYLHHLILHYQAGTSSIRKILLVWSVPNTECLEWCRKWMDEILRMEGRRDVLQIQLFVTKPRHRGEVVSNTGSVQMFPGRCNPETIMEREMAERIGAVGVTVCGPGAFADSVRAAVRQQVENGCVEFQEEGFTY